MNHSSIQINTGLLPSQPAVVTRKVTNEIDVSSLQVRKRSRSTEPQPHGPKKQKIHKIIRFQAEPEIKKVTLHPREVWYTRKELSEIKKSARQSIKKNNSFEGLLSETYRNCDLATSNPLVSHTEFQNQRGLERWSSAVHHRRRVVDLLTVKCEFFLEQSKSGGADCLAETYRLHSKQSQRFAAFLGMSDAAAAQIVYEESSVPSRRTSV